MNSSHIVNPSTGRMVLRTGTRGQKVVQAKGVFSSHKAYMRATQLWDKWARATASDRNKVSQMFWNTRLNDPIVSQYPIYLKTYVPVLTKACRILKALP